MTKLKELIASATLVSLWACSGSPEQATLDQFFRAAQTNDSATLAYMSAVRPPWAVDSWDVVEISSRTTVAFELPGLLEEFEAAKKARDVVLEERKKYAEENQDEVEQVIVKLREDPEYKFRGKLAEIQDEWLRMTEERKEKEGVFQELKRVVDIETGIATKSVVRQLKVGDLRGNIAVTEMLLNLKPKDRDAIPYEVLPYKVTLRKYDLAEPKSDRIEPSRWVIVDIEGTTEEARAAASLPAKTAQPASESETASETSGAAESKPPARSEPTYQARELRGAARVQIVAPESKPVGDDVVSTVRMRNASKDWIVGFTVTEFWYDQQGNTVTSSSRTHPGRFMPGEVIEMELRTRKEPNFYQNQFKFSHANGDVNATTVGGFPKT